MYEWIPKSIEQSRNIFQELSLDWGFSMGEAATREEVHECEQELCLLLPHSYREFLLKYNGAHLFYSNAGTRSDSDSWWANSGVVVFGTKSLLEYRPLIYDAFLYNDDSNVEEYPSVLSIAYLGRIGTGDFCALNRDELIGAENLVIDCDHELSPSEWKDAPIAISFEEWLRKMFSRVIENRSQPEYWLEDTLDDNSLAIA